MIEPVDPASVIPDYETDLAAVGTNRTAAPPDGKDQDWTEIHPNGSRLWLAGELS
jgi:hypothetical protein